MTSDDGCCADKKYCCNETGAEFEYTDGACDDSALCMDNCPYGEKSICIESTVSNCMDNSVDRTYETYSKGYDNDNDLGNGHDYINENTYRPVYSNLSMNNSTGKRNSTECAIITMKNFRRYYVQKREREFEKRLKWILAIGFVLIICKFDVVISFY